MLHRTRGKLRKMLEQGKITEEEFRGLTAGNEGRINPELAEWLMGYKRAFTQLVPTPRASEYKGSAAKRFIGGGATDISSANLWKPLPVGQLAD